jgi:trk system potassium uptake protein TrkH
MAIVPMAESAGGGSLYLLRAESTGPQVGKMLPKMRDTAKLLYIIYAALTALMLVLLLLGGTPIFDSVNLSLATAGTGGFAVLNDSMASYGVYAQTVTGIFMALFGINFNLYFFLMLRDFKKALAISEVRVYLGIMAAAIAGIGINLTLSGQMELVPAFGHAAFQVSSIMTTTGFATTDFNLWPEFSKMILMCLMIVGACAGSTGGGVKVSRIAILVQSAKNSLMRTLRPRQIKRVRFDGAAVDSATVNGVLGYMAVYSLIAIGSLLIISVDNFSMESNLSAVMAAFNNIGPGLDAFGPTSSFAAFSGLSKIVLTVDMLIGRLEIFPMLLLFTPSVWKRAG